MVAGYKDPAFEWNGGDGDDGDDEPDDLSPALQPDDLEGPGANDSRRHKRRRRGGEHSDAEYEENSSSEESDNSTTSEDEAITMMKQRGWMVFGQIMTKNGGGQLREFVTPPRELITSRLDVSTPAEALHVLADWQPVKEFLTDLDPSTITLAYQSTKGYRDSRRSSMKIWSRQADADKEEDDDGVALLWEKVKMGDKGEFGSKKSHGVLPPRRLLMIARPKEKEASGKGKCKRRASSSSSSSGTAEEEEVDVLRVRVHLGHIVREEGAIKAVTASIPASTSAASAFGSPGADSQPSDSHSPENHGGSSSSVSGASSVSTSHSFVMLTAGERDRNLKRWGMNTRSMCGSSPRRNMGRSGFAYSRGSRSLRPSPLSRRQGC